MQRIWDIRLGARLALKATAGKSLLCASMQLGPVQGCLVSLLNGQRSHDLSIMMTQHGSQ